MMDFRVTWMTLITCIFIIALIWPILLIDSPDEANIKSNDLCIDGVVYLSGQYTLAAKFNRDGTIVTCEERP